MKIKLFSLLLLGIISVTSCVSSKKFKSVKSELEDYKTALERCKQNQIDCEEDTTIAININGKPKTEC